MVKPLHTQYQKNWNRQQMGEEEVMLVEKGQHVT